MKLVNGLLWRIPVVVSIQLFRQRDELLLRLLVRVTVYLVYIEIPQDLQLLVVWEIRKPLYLVNYCIFCLEYVELLDCILDLLTLSPLHDGAHLTVIETHHGEFLVGRRRRSLRDIELRRVS